MQKLRKLNTSQKIYIVIGLICAIWFSLPFFTFGIVNVGNRTGCAVGLLLCLYGLFADKINNKLRQIWKSSIGKAVLIIIALILIACIILALYISAGMIKACLTKPSGNPVVIVLGCKVLNGGPSLMLYERLVAAEQYLKEHGDAICILSGGQGSDESISEALAMKNYLISCGIDPARLILEDRSTTTKENLEFSARIMKDLGLGNNVAIVTNEFHEYRAMIMAKKAGLTASAIPAKTHWWLFPTYVVREWYATIYEWAGLYQWDAAHTYLEAVK